MKQQISTFSKVGLVNKDQTQHLLIIENIIFTREGYKKSLYRIHKTFQIKWTMKHLGLQSHQRTMASYF